MYGVIYGGAMKKVLMVTSEAVPYVKTGGLADVVGSLPRYINKSEFDVRIILPKYACMEQSFLPDLQFVTHFYVDLNWRRQYAGVFKAEYQGITYYFIDNEFYFAGNNPYHNIYEDVEKFAFFSKAVLMALPLIDFQPDVIQCHDWQTGLVPVYLRTVFEKDVFYAGMKTLFTIHNMKFQGRWMVREVMDITGLPEEIFTADKLECYGEANYLKGGCVYADAISSVSPTYAMDITTPEGGEGLAGLMYARRNDLYGILNGIDYEEFNPETDKTMTQNFNVITVSIDKEINKLALQRAMGLPEKEDVFLIGMVSRMTDQKGFDLVAYMMEEILSTMNVQFVVLGTGEHRFEEMFGYFQSKYPDKISAHIGYSEDRAHQIYASCDAFLMPSLFEPCGLSQMMSMRYGTIPIVRETGGLKDTVDSYNEFENTGTGFSFKEYNAHDMLHVIQYAYDIFANHRDKWDALVLRAMTTDFSWNSSARKYEKLYDKLISK